MSAHARAFGDVINTYRWSYVGILLNVDEFEPEMFLPLLKSYLKDTKMIVPMLTEFQMNQLGIVPSQQNSSWFHSNASATILQAYVHSVRVQRVRVVCVFASLNSVPELVTALEEEYMTGEGIGLLLAESLLSQDLLRSNIPEIQNNASVFSPSRSFLPLASNLFSLQGALVIRPATSVNSPPQLDFFKLFANAYPNAFSDPGPSSPYLFDAITLLCTALQGIRIDSKSSNFTGAWITNLTRSVINGVSGFIALESLSSTISSNPLHWQRKWFGGSVLYNVQGTELVLVGAFDNGAYQPIRGIIWPGNQASPPSATILSLGVVFQSGLIESESGVLGALLAVDLINWASLRPTPDKLASCTQSQTRYFAGQPANISRFQMVPVPPTVQTILPQIPRGTILEIPPEYIFDDRCTLTGSLSVAPKIYNLTGRVLSMIGPYCSASTQTLLTPVPVVNSNGLTSLETPVNSTVPFVSFSVASSLFQSPQVFPTLLRTWPSQVANSQLMLSLLIQLGIRRVAAVYVNEAFGFSGVNDLFDWAPVFDVSIVTAIKANKADSVSVIQDTIAPLKVCALIDYMIRMYFI
jgi:hypothetical protein